MKKPIAKKKAPSKKWKCSTCGKRAESPVKPFPSTDGPCKKPNGSFAEGHSWVEAR
jgi:hypothetical protein